MKPSPRLRKCDEPTAGPSSPESSARHLSVTHASTRRQSHLAHLGLNRRPTSTVSRAWPLTQDGPAISEPEITQNPGKASLNHRISKSESVSNISARAEPTGVVAGIDSRTISATGLKKHPKEIRKSKYTTGYLDESGWYPINESLCRTDQSVLANDNASHHSQIIDTEDYPSESQNGYDDGLSFLNQKYRHYDTSLNPTVGHSYRCKPRSDKTLGVMESKNDQDTQGVNDVALENKGSIPISTDPGRERKPEGIIDTYDTVGSDYKRQRVPISELKAEKVSIHHGIEHKTPPNQDTTAWDSQSSTDSEGELGRDRPNTNGCSQNDQWELLETNADSLRLGKIAPDKFSVRIRNNVKGGTVTHTFQKISKHFFDWNNKDHVRYLSKWRSQILRRHGFSRRRPLQMYHPDEEAWLILYHKKVKAVIDAGHLVKIPRSTAIVEAFNGFFEGRVLKNSKGEDMAAREPRGEITIRNKLTHQKFEAYKLREKIRSCIKGKRPKAVYLPSITERELKDYMQDGTVVVEEAV